MVPPDGVGRWSPFARVMRAECVPGVHGPSAARWAGRQIVAGGGRPRRGVARPREIDTDRQLHYISWAGAGAIPGCLLSGEGLGSANSHRPNITPNCNCMVPAGIATIHCPFTELLRHMEDNSKNLL